MPQTSQNYIDLLSHVRFRELMMQESLENLMEFSLSMSRPCPPDCLTILSVTAPEGTRANHSSKSIAPPRKTTLPQPSPARCG